MKDISGLIIVIILVFTSCEEKDTGVHYSIGFISEYVSPERMEINLTDGPIGIHFSGYRHSYNRGKDLIYLNFAKKYGDTKYKSNLQPWLNSTITKDVYGVNVICDTDIDDAHPAGTPLDDMVLMQGWTYGEYIRSGYKKYTKEVQNDYGYHLYGYGQRGHTPFIKYLKDVTKEDLILLRSDFYLHLSKDWPAGEYNLTITVYGEDFELSKEITCTIH